MILNEVIQKFPTRTVAYFNLGDAYWGLNDKIKAKQAYNKYIELMKKSGRKRRVF